MFDIIPGDVVSSNILAAAAAMTQVLGSLCAGGVNFLLMLQACGA